MPPRSFCREGEAIMPLISVITPVYQAEALLTGCIESVRSQTLTDWELLLIDDGSRDGSGAICDAYAEQDRRIRVFHKENGGVSSARNLGLAHAEGTYLAFLDADDRFEPDFLEVLYGLIGSEQADTAGCAHRNVSGEEDPGRTELLLPAGVYEDGALRERVVLPLLGERLRQPVFNGFIWRYLYTAEILRAASLRFAGAYLEDELFLMEYFCHARRLAVTEQPLYRYYENPASATHKYMKNFERTFADYMERKAELARRYDLERACPQWRENSNWAGTLIAVGNEYAAGNPKSLAEKQAAVAAWCRRPEMAEALAALRPQGLNRRKQLVADLLRGGHYWTLSRLYQWKNR